MAEKPRVKNQHYVPQAILRRFLAASGHLHVYDKWERRTFSGPTRNVASETGFYDIQIGDEVFSFDPEMGRIENANFGAIESIVTSRSLSPLTELDQWKLAYYFAVQTMRTRAARDMFSQMETGLKEALPSKNLDESQMPPGFFMDEDQLKASSLSNLELAFGLAPHLLSKHWLLDAPPEGEGFFISDNPVVRRNANPSPGFLSNTGFACPGMQVYMPLSPTLTLCLLCDTLISELRELRDSSLSPVPILDALDSRDTVPVLSETVMHQNSLQVAQSTRFLFSSTGDFSLVEEMLTTNPELAKPVFLEVK
jgi:hypothetical protein